MKAADDSAVYTPASSPFGFPPLIPPLPLIDATNRSTCNRSKATCVRTRSWDLRVVLQIVLGALIPSIFAGCEQVPPVRVYDAPKNDTQFVSGPLAGADMSSTTLRSGPAQAAPSQVSSTGPKRILGSIIPIGAGCYFLKATDTPERLEPLLSDIQTITQEFQVDETSGRPSNSLPEGWVMNPRNDIAIAEFVSPASKGSVRFTVTALAMPSKEEWPGYLQSNVNRWRGQLKLAELPQDAIADSLLAVPRSGSDLPAYIFDAVGSGSGSMAPSNPSTPPTKGPANSPPRNPGTAPNAPVPPNPGTPPNSGRPDLKYTLPKGWVVGQGSQFRLATFNIDSEGKSGEVSVSMATDNPQANTMMWFQQVTREADPSKLEPLVQQTIDRAEKFAVGAKQASLYQIRSSAQADAPALLVVSLPTDSPDRNLFIKLIGDNALAAAQKENLIQFVQSITIQ